MKLRNLSIACASVLATSTVVAGDVDIGQLYRGDFRVVQNNDEQTELGTGVLLNNLSRDEIRLAGLRMFTNPFIKPEGYGDGDTNPPSPNPSSGPNRSNQEGDRGSIQGNGTFQRINGLDAQTCLECHSVISRRKVPQTFGIGGVGGVNNTVMGAGGATFVNLTLADDPSTPQNEKQQNINGRVINPPFIFGAGGIELLANEMTIELNAQLNATPPGTTTALSAKGVSFGEVTRNNDGSILVDGSGNAVGVVGVFDSRPIFNGEPNDDFLVVAPFGRKGDNKSTRTFDIGALSFHFGMQIGNHDNDGDGVPFEVTEGELSVLSVLIGTAQTPFQKRLKDKARQGKRLFNEIGCTECHIPKMETNTKHVGFRFPEIGNQPLENVHTTVDLTKPPMSFEENNHGGITVELFADLKRHFMGENLAEFNGDAMFTTMRLWGVADTAPYLHDGRALTIKDAIQTHGLLPTSEAFPAVSNFNGLSGGDQDAVLAFLDTLRVPNGTFPYLTGSLAKQVAHQQGVHD